MTEFEEKQLEILASIAESQKEIMTTLKEMNQEMNLIREEGEGIKYLANELERCIFVGCDRFGNKYSVFRVAPVK